MKGKQLPYVIAREITGMHPGTMVLVNGSKQEL